MSTKTAKHTLSAFVSLLLALALLTGSLGAVGARAAGEEDAPDRNILAYAIQEAKRAIDDGTAGRLIASEKVKLEAALATAETVYANQTATGEEIQASYKALQEAIWRLSYIKADKTALAAAITRAEGTDLTQYNASKAQAVNSALARAKTVAGDEELSVADQSVVDAAAAALTGALNALTDVDGGGGTPAPKPAEPEKPEEPDTPAVGDFPDVKPDAWYAEDVRYVAENGLMQGTGEGFRPELNTSRAMLVTVLYRMAGSPAQSGAGGVWYDAPLAWATAAGITDGSNPESNITREQIAVLLFRYAGAKGTGAGLTAFADGHNVSDWAKEAMSWAVSQGLITGKTGGVLDPQGAATRAETAALLARFDRMNQKG